MVRLTRTPPPPPPCPPCAFPPSPALHVRNFIWYNHHLPPSYHSPALHGRKPRYVIWYHHHPPSPSAAHSIESPTIGAWSTSTPLPPPPALSFPKPPYPLLEFRYVYYKHGTSLLIFPRTHFYNSEHMICLMVYSWKVELKSHNQL